MSAIKRILRIVAALLLLVVLLLIGAVVFLQSRFGSFVSGYVRTHYGWTLKIGRAELRLNPLSIAFESIELSVPGQKPFLNAKSAKASLPYSSLWGDEFEVREVDLEGPQIDLDQLPKFETAEKSSGGSSRKFRIDRLRIGSAELDVGAKKIQDIKLEGRVDSSGTQLSKIEARFETMELQARGSVSDWSDPDLNLTYNLRGQLDGMAEYVPLKEKLGGSVDVGGAIQGKIPTIKIDGKIADTSLSLDGQPFHAGGDFVYDRGKPQQPIGVNLHWSDFPVRAAAAYAEALKQIGSVSKGTIRYSGSSDLWSGSADIMTQLTAGAGKIPLSGEIKGGLRNKIFVLEQADLVVRSAHAKATGTLNETAVNLNVVLVCSDPSALAGIVPQLRGLPGAYNASVQLSGPYNSLLAQGKLAGEMPDSQIQAQGSVQLATQVVSLNFEGSTNATDLKKYVPALQEGTADFSGTARGNWKNPDVQLNLRAAGIRAYDYTVGDLQLDASGRLQDISFQLAAPFFHVNSQGKYNALSGAYEATGSIQDVSIDDARKWSGMELSGISGMASANFEMSGETDHLNDSAVHLRFTDARLKWSDVEIQLAEGSEIGIENKRLMADLSAQGPSVNLKIKGSAGIEGDHPAGVVIEGEVDTVLIEKVNHEWKGNGPAKLNVTVRGTVSHPDITGNLSASNISFTHVSDQQVLTITKAEANFMGSKVDVKGVINYNQTDLTVDASIPFDKTDGRIRVEIPSISLEHWAPESKVAGTLNVVADFQGKGLPVSQVKDPHAQVLPSPDWSGTLTVVPTGVKVADKEIKTDGPLVLTYRNGIVSMDRSHLSSGELLDFLASGSYNVQTGALDTQVKASARIDFLSSVKADMQSSGPVALEFTAKGTLEHPKIEGTIQMNDALIRIPQTPIFFDHIQLAAHVYEDRVVVEKLEARSGGGTVTGGGQINWKEKGGNIWIRGQNVAMIYPEGLRSQSDYDLKLTASGNTFLLSGNMVVLRSIYDQELNFRNPLLRKVLSAKPSTTKQSYLENLVKLSLEISTDSDFTIRNRLANARLGGKIKVEGTAYRPRYTGRLVLREGSVFYIQGRTYEVEKASINFFGSDLLEPDLDVEFSTLAQDFNNNSFYEVFIRFGGPLSSIEFRSVRSTPSLSQDQIFSLLTRGTSEGGGTEQAGVIFREQLLAAIAGQAFAAPASAIASTIGLSRIQLQQASLNSINDSKTRLVLSKDVAAGFSLIYSFVIDQPEDYTWITSYRYKRDYLVRVIGEDDSTYTASFSHRIQFGKGTRSLVENTKSERDRLNPIISGIEIQNQSSISEEQIRKSLHIAAGDRYRYWEFQDSIVKVESQIQELGYLSPSVDLDEVKTGSQVLLKLKIDSGKPSEMRINGYSAPKKAMEQYRIWWAQGISGSVVQQLVREDLIRRLHLSGYHKAEVSVDTKDEGGKTVYVFDVNLGPRFSNVELQFKDVSVYKPSELQSSLSQLYPSSAAMFSEAIHDFSGFAEKIEVLYAQRGYLKPSIKPGSLVFESGKITRQVIIEEGPVSKVSDVLVSQGQRFPAELSPKLEVKKGENFIPGHLLDDEVKIHSFYESLGYRDIAVEYSFDFVMNSTDLNITWSITKGPQAKIASITVSGNLTTRTDVILKQMRLKEGSILTLHNQSLAQKRLYDLGVFQEVSLDLEGTDKPGLYDLHVSVIEGKRYEAQYGIRYNTQDHVSGELNYVDANLFGRAQRLNFYTRISSNVPLFRIDYIQPPAGRLWDNLRISFFRDDRDDDIQAQIDEQLVRLPFNVKQTELVVEQPIKMTYHVQMINGFEYGPSHVVTTDQNLPMVEFSGTIADFKTSLVGDYRDVPLDATKGSFFSLGLEYAPSIIGSDIVFTRVYGQYFFYKRFGPFISASGLRMGFLKINSGILSISEKFRTGGSTTIRGFEQDAVFPNARIVGILFGGDSVLILNQEIRFPIFKYVSGAVFYDGGNVYTLASDFNPSDIRNSAGFGVRFGAGGFLLRFDLGYNLQPREFEPTRVFHFGIGQAF